MIRHYALLQNELGVIEAGVGAVRGDDLRLNIQDQRKRFYLYSVLLLPELIQLPEQGKEVLR